MASIASLSVKIGADIEAFTSGLNTAVRAANKAAGDIERQFKGLSNLGKTFSAVGMEMSKAFTLPIVALAGFAISARSDMQKLEAGLDAVSGSATETAKQLARLKEIAKLPGLSLDDATKASISLQAVGITAEKSERYIKAFGNALALVGKGAADLNPVITQLQQMSTKTKVVSEDLKPIIQAVPQAAKVIKDYYGSIDPEALQKMGVGTKEFTEVLLNGLEKLPKASGGIANAFENLKDAVKNSFAEIGKSLEGPTTFVLDRLASVVEGVQDLAKQFATLPDPIKAGTGALIGVVAALGPLMLGFGQLAKIGPAIAANLTRLGAVFGIGGGAVLAWAAGIAVAIAALTALGTWVSQNWEPVKAVVLQAWDGLTDLWNFQWKGVVAGLTGWWNVIKTVAGVTWGPIIKFFATLWDGIAPAMTVVWNSIANLLEGIWVRISTIANDLWEGIKSRFNAFVTWAKATIPGVAKLMSLGDTWDSEQKKLAASRVVAPTAAPAKTTGPKFAGGNGDALKDALGVFGVHEQASIATMTAALALVKKEFDAGKISAADYVKAIEKMAEAQNAASHPALELELAIMRLDGENRKQLEPLRQAELALKKQSLAQIEVNTSVYQSLPVFVAMREKLLSIAEAAQRSAVAMQTMAMLKAGVEALLKPYAALAATIKDLGISTSAELEARYEATKKALEDAKATNDALGVEFYTRKDLLKLQYETLKAKEASIGLTLEEQKILIGLHKTLETANRSVIDGLEKQKKPLSEVSTILTNMSQKIADAIVNWTSMKDVALSTLKEIGKAILSEIIQNFMKSTNLIGKVTDGLSGVLSKIPGLGGIFGKAAGTATTTAANTAGGLSGMLGSSSSSISSATKAVSSSLTSVVGAVGGVVSAISGVIGNFQQAAMNKTLDLIEHEVRYSQIHLLNTLNKANEFWPYMKSVWESLIRMEQRQMDLGSGYSSSLAGVGGGGNVTINLTAGTVVSSADDLANFLIRELRLRGLLKP